MFDIQVSNYIVQNSHRFGLYQIQAVENVGKRCCIYAEHAQLQQFQRLTAFI